MKTLKNKRSTIAGTAVPLLLVLVLVLSLAACGGGNDIAGGWRGSMQINELLVRAADRELEELMLSLGLDSRLPSAAGYLNVPDIACAMRFEEDGSYTLSLDGESLLACADAYRAGLEACLRDRFSALLMDTLALIGRSVEAESPGELETILGVGLDEAISEAIGMSLRDFSAQAAGSVFGSVTELAAGVEYRGRYKMEDGRLWLSAGPDYDIDPDVFSRCTLTGDSLTVSWNNRGEGLGGLSMSMNRAA